MGNNEINDSKAIERFEEILKPIEKEEVDIDDLAKHVEASAMEVKEIVNDLGKDQE